MSDDRRVTISVGIPVCNGAKTIARAIESIQKQTFKNISVIISNNASTDDTRKICLQKINGDARFLYTEHSTNIEALLNFKSIFRYVTTDYFVFLAADDYWEPEFLELNLKNLIENETAVASVSKIFYDSLNKENKYDLDGGYPIKGDIFTRLKKYFEHPLDNSRFYSLFKSEVIKKSFEKAHHSHAWDWYIMAMTLCHGEHLRVDRYLMHREITENYKYHESVIVDNKNHFSGLLFPIWPMSFYFLKEAPLLLKFKIFPALIKLNIEKHMEFIAYKSQMRHFLCNSYCKFLYRLFR